MNFLLVFFIPSVVFWCSGIRAEGLLLLFMMLMIYNGQAYARYARKRRILGIIAGFAGSAADPLPVPGCFPASLYRIHRQSEKKDFLPQVFQPDIWSPPPYILSELISSPANQLSRPLQQAQQGFFRLNGNTRYELDSLQPGPISFFKILPQAVTNSASASISLGRQKFTSVGFFR